VSEALHSGFCEIEGAVARHSVPCSAFWLSQRTFLIAVNSGKPCGKAARLQLRVCGNGYKSIVLVVSRLFFLTVLASGQNPLLSDRSQPIRLRKPQVQGTQERCNLQCSGQWLRIKAYSDLIQ